jgi:hypothetical protein
VIRYQSAFWDSARWVGLRFAGRSGGAAVESPIVVLARWARPGRCSDVDRRRRSCAGFGRKAQDAHGASPHPGVWVEPAGASAPDPTVKVMVPDTRSPSSTVTSQRTRYPPLGTCRSVAAVAAPAGAAADSVAAAVGDVAQLLDVDVHQVTGGRVFVAADR